ncbi:MAG TPA: hypothetical protein VKX29_06640 [Brumimicrobium sp.]|nr:hypothetical protein [Brumimicrobium sp.]
MPKPITLTLTEKQFKLLRLYLFIGDMVKDSVVEKTRKENMEHIDLHQLLDKAAYEAKLKGSGKEEDFYYYGADIEEEMSEVLAAYDDYIESGQKSAFRVAFIPLRCSCTAALYLLLHIFGLCEV